ncbi:MAG: hypothetical protein DMD49_02775 [Gemmatimonadetes bacterium]|nr:MAG: hypothetical protein DMD49_02775 [Gemmatimonadota bacterium]
MRRRALPSLLAVACVACGGTAPRPATAPPPQQTLWFPPGAIARDSAAPPATEPVLPPSYAYAAGLMPLASTGVDQFRARHATYDGRGVVIGILDSGVDPGAAGLAVTSTGAPKILDLRDFSDEGRVFLTPVVPSPDGTVTVAGHSLMGAGRIARITSATTWYAGELRELPLGRSPAADLNGNGQNTDAFPVIVVKATDGWVAFMDTNLNGSFDDETPVRDYRQGHEMIALGSKPLTMAANLDERNGAPLLDFVFDNSSHGTHVAGIAAGHDLFGIPGFDGVAPGAQLLGLKISNNARGGISVTGGMQRAMAYAARYAEQRGLRLVLNLSFGVGNELEGRAEIDSIVNAFLAAHPAIVFAISAGNDGPGLSTIGFPGSADLALSTGAAYPGTFAQLARPEGPRAPNNVGWWSARGGELAKPDLLTPGVAFSAVPRFDMGQEIKGGTSMAAPQAAGLAACLISALAQEGRSVGAAEIGQALRVSAIRYAGATLLDEGAGEPRLEVAYRWLAAGHQGSQYLVRTSDGASAAFRRDGLTGPGDTVEVFHVRHLAGLRAAQFTLRSSVSWLSAPPTVVAAPLETSIPVRYAPTRFVTPGAYLGAVTAWNPSDTLAGPLFTLVTTVVVPHDLAAAPLADLARPIGPGRVQRYFLRVARPGATLEATVTLSDSLNQQAAARLYEPSGQPFRDAEETALGRRGGSTARFVVRGEDLVPGVYELDVFAPTLSGVTATVHASVAPVTLDTTGAGGTLEATNTGQATVVARVSAALLGAERTYAVEGRGAPAETLAVRVPEWAASAVLDVAMPRGQWHEFTGFGVTEFDSTGQQVGQGPLNYSVGRERLRIAALRDRPLLIELYPAFARSDGARPWRAAVRVQFLLEREQPLGDGQRVSIVPGGRVVMPVFATPPLVLAAGFAPLVETRVHPETVPGVAAVRRY